MTTPTVFMLYQEQSVTVVVMLKRLPSWHLSRTYYRMIRSLFMAINNLCLDDFAPTLKFSLSSDPMFL